MIAVRCDTCQAETDEDTAELLWLKVTPGAAADGSVRHEYHFCGWPCLGRGGPPRRDVVAPEQATLVVDLASALTEAADRLRATEDVDDDVLERWRALVARGVGARVVRPGCRGAVGAATDRTYLSKVPHEAPAFCTPCWLEMRDEKFKLEAEVARLKTRR